MKIALISTTPPPVGGIAKWTSRMLDIKLDNNWSIVLVDDKPINRESFGDNISFKLQNEIKRAIRVWYDLYKTLQDCEIKIVHACPIATLPSLGSAYIESIIAQLRKKKFIAHFRCTVPNMIGGRISKFFLNRLCNNCDYIIVLNEKTEDYLKARTKCGAIEIVPNFIDASTNKKERIIKEKIEKAVYVGGVTVEKGCLDIVEVAKSFPNIEFELIGKAEKIIIDEAQMVPNVKLLGVLSSEDVFKRMNEADIFLFLSVYPGEGFSNALVEAMSTGLPCIVTNWAANADMIEDKGGIVLPIHSPKDVIKAIYSISDKTSRKEMSEWNIEKVKRTYDASIVTKRYAEIYDEVSLRYKP